MALTDLISKKTSAGAAVLCGFLAFTNYSHYLEQRQATITAYTLNQYALGRQVYEKIGANPLGIKDSALEYAEKNAPTSGKHFAVGSAMLAALFAALATGKWKQEEY